MKQQSLVRCGPAVQKYSTLPLKHLVLDIKWKLLSLFGSDFLSLFQGYEGSLIKLTSKQVCYKTRWALCFCAETLTSEGISQSLTMLSLLALHNFLLINTFNFFVSPLSYFFPSWWFSSCWLWRISTLCQEVPGIGKKNKLLGGGEGYSVAPTCLWQSDSTLVVTDSQLRWDGKGDGKRILRCQSERFDKSSTDGWVLPQGARDWKWAQLAGVHIQS